MNNKVYCNDGCNKQFTLTNPHVENIEEDVERYFLRCPYCRQEYTSYYLDDRMKKMQQEMKSIKSKGNLKRKQIDRVLKLQKQMQSANEKLMQKHDANEQ